MFIEFPLSFYILHIKIFSYHRYLFERGYKNIDPKFSTDRQQNISYTFSKNDKGSDVRRTMTRVGITIVAFEK
jgi:hypothetical protein